MCMCACVILFLFFWNLEALLITPNEIQTTLVSPSQTLNKITQQHNHYLLSSTLQTPPSKMSRPI